MKLLLAALAACVLSAQAVPLIPPGQRKDVSAFVYADYPAMLTTRTVGQAKGKVVILAFLAEGFKDCTKAIKELEWLQGKEGALDLLVVPVYDVLSRRALEAPLPGRPGGGIMAGPGSLTDASSSKDVFRGGMFKFASLQFRIFREFAEGAHSELFPRFEKQPAIFLTDRQGRIAAQLWGYEKGQMTHAAQALLDEK